MPIRGFGTQTLTGAAQPLFGTTITTPVRPAPDMRTGRLDQASAPSQSVIGVEANIFRQGDHVLIGSSAAFTQANTLSPDGGVVSAIDTAANTITVNGLTRAHNASDWAVLALPCAQISIQNNQANVYLGEDATVAAGSATLVAEIVPSGVFALGFPAIANIIETQHLWVQGTSGDSFLSYLLTI